MDGSLTRIADSPAFGQEKFFEGKTSRIIVGFTASGGFDAHSHAIDRHMSKHIPGSPSILVENMAGAGSMIAAEVVTAYRTSRIAKYWRL